MKLKLYEDFQYLLIYHWKKYLAKKKKKKKRKVTKDTHVSKHLKNVGANVKKETSNSRNPKVKINVKKS